MKLPALHIGNLTATVPIVQGGMGIGVSLSGLASAVANEGGVGVISAANVGFNEPDFKTNTVNANLRALKSELLKAREKTKTGIILTASAQEKPQIAEVVAVGPGGMVEGHEVTMEVKVGQKVITSKYAGTEVKADGVEYNIVRQNDILAIVE